MANLSVGIIGQGSFGRFLEQLLPQIMPELVVHSISATKASEEALRSLAQADVVVVCVSIKHYLATMERLVPYLEKHTVLVDVATVKAQTTTWLQEHRAVITYVATHPMFGPASYEKSGNLIAGFRLVVTDHNLSTELYRTMYSRLDQLGIRVIEMGAEEHDQYLAETLFLRHFLAQVVTAADFVRTDIDTVPFGFLMDAVESVREDTELFTDVFDHNPYCKQVIDRLAAATQQVHYKLQHRA